MQGEQDLTRERFAALGEAYGADLRRWPAAARSAAEALCARDEDDAGVRAILTREARLDIQLDAHAIPAPSPALVGRILAAAPQPALLWSRARLWLSGLGLAGVGLTGAVTGALALSLATPALLDHHADRWADSQTIFGDVDLDGIADD